MKFATLRKMSSGSSYIRGFDGLRAFSILFVIWTHAGLDLLLPEGGFLRERLFFLVSGTAGVNLFFAISGYLITTLLLREKQQQGRIHLRKFFIRRFLRLLPPMVPFYLVLVLLMATGHAHAAWYGLPLSVLYLYNYAPRAQEFYSGELGHTWSLAVEEQFYLAWPFVLQLWQRRGALLVGLAVVLLSVGAIFAYPEIHLRLEGRDFSLPEAFYPERFTLPAVSSILVGALVRLCAGASWWEPVRARWWVICILAMGTTLVLPEPLLGLRMLIHAMGAALLLQGVVDRQESRAVSWLELPLLRYVGRISYGLYIWQGLFLRTGPGWEPKSWINELPFSIALTIGAAVLSYELLEKRMLRYKNKFR